MSGGLLIDGRIVPLDGIDVIGSHDAAWAHLDAGDCRPRKRRPTMIVAHKTIADDPEIILAGAGPVGGAEYTAEYWQRKKPDGTEVEYSGAAAIIEESGRIACLCDLAQIETYNATVSNEYAIGFEMREQPGGRVFRATLSSGVAFVFATAEACGIQIQIPSRVYNGHPMKRMLDGGSNMIGVFGHRDNTEQRGRWDPGDVFFDMLRAAGAEAFDFEKGQDLVVWAKRQEDLVAKGHKLTVDGIPGPATTAALKLEGYRGGIWALGKT